VVTFHLIRHTTHDLIGHVLVGRSVDMPLNAAGEREARALALRLATEPVTRVLSSPRRRARETATPIAAALRLDIDLAPELDEHDGGDWSGRSFNMLQFDPLWRRWNEQRSTVHPPGGESMAELQARVVGFLRNLSDRYHGEILVLVSHAEPIRAALMYAHGISLDEFRRVEVPIGAIRTITIGGQHDLKEMPYLKEMPFPSFVEQGAA
jgi:probable phosphoglycerate mutase